MRTSVANQCLFDGRFSEKTDPWQLTTDHRQLTDEDDWRTGESSRALPDDHHGNPTPIPFVSFAAFCSNPLRCLLLSNVRSGSGGSNTDADSPTSRYGALHLAEPFGPRRTRTIRESPKALPDDHHENPTPIPFVSFAAFCSNPLRCLLLRIDSKRFGRRQQYRPGSAGTPT